MITSQQARKNTDAANSTLDSMRAKVETLIEDESLLGGDKIILELRKSPFHEQDKKTANLLISELNALGYKCFLCVDLVVEW